MTGGQHQLRDIYARKLPLDDKCFRLEANGDSGLICNNSDVRTRTPDNTFELNVINALEIIKERRRLCS